MFKDKLSKITRRIFYVLFAVVISIALWLFVEITQNEMRASAATGIEIELVHEDILRSKGLLISNVITGPLTLRFEGSSSDIQTLTAPGAITVEVDLSTITSPGIVDLLYTINWPPGFNPNNITIINWTEDRVFMEIDRFDERQIDVRVNYTGNTATDMLMTDLAIPDPLTLTVSGPEQIVSRIQYAYVPIFIENISATYIDDLEFILIDYNDEILDEEDLDVLEFNHELIRVTVPVRELKDVVLTINLLYDASTSDENTNWTIEPSTIRVSGDPEIISELNNILLVTIDMQTIGNATSHTEELPIPIPNHIRNESGETQARVHIEMMRLEIAHLSTTNIFYMNLPTGHHADIITQSIDIRLRGTSEDLAQITPMNIRVFADVADVGLGMSRIPARVAIDGLDVNVGAVGELYITVNIQED